MDLCNYVTSITDLTSQVLVMYMIISKTESWHILMGACMLKILMGLIPGKEQLWRLSKYSQ